MDPTAAAAAARAALKTGGNPAPTPAPVRDKGAPMGCCAEAKSRSVQSQLVAWRARAGPGWAALSCWLLEPAAETARLSSSAAWVSWIRQEQARCTKPA